MFKGILNSHVQFAPESVTLSGTKTPAKLQSCGNPLLGEELFVHWQDKKAVGVEIALPLDGTFFVDCVKLELADKTNLESIVLYNRTKDAVLFRYHAETGKTIPCGAITLDAGVETDCLILEMDGDLSSAGLTALDVYGSDPALTPLFPTPASVTYGEGVLPTSKLTGWVASCDDGKRAAAILTEKLAEKGISLTGCACGNVRFISDAAIPENGCRVCVSGEGVTISASDLRGFVYGAETLLKLIGTDGIPYCTINDHPYMAYRGVHIMLPGRADIPYFKRVIKYIFSPMGYNLLFLQISAGMEFDSHPEINQAYVNAVEKAEAGLWPKFPHSCIGGGRTITKAEVADLVAYCRSFGIDVIPEVQSLGHVQFMTQAYPEIAEIEEIPEGDKKDIDTRQEDERPKTFYKHCYCPSNEKSYELLFDLLDEIIDVVKPTKYVHMGHDEVYQLGICPKCKTQTPAALLAKDINRIYNHLAEKGLKMMIWGDMLQPVTRYQSFGAMDLIPKDIVMLDFVWYFHMDKDIEDNLLEKGFPVMFGNLYSSHFPRYESRIRKEGIIGGQCSTWVAPNEEELGREGKLYDLLFTAEMLWTETYTSHLRLTYDRILKAMIPGIRASLQQTVYPSTLTSAKATVLTENPACYPLAEAPTVTDLSVNACYDSLVFAHNTVKKIARIPWIALEQAGKYVVEYADGEVLEIPATYGGTISHWNRRQNEPFKHGFYRHNGYSAAFLVDADEWKTPNGAVVSVYRHEWINPRKDVAIAKISLVQNEECGATVFVHSITGIKA